MKLLAYLPYIHTHAQTNKTTKDPKADKKYRQIQTDMIKQINMYGLKIQNRKI